MLTPFSCLKALVLSAGLIALQPAVAQTGTVTSWLTTADKSSLLQPQTLSQGFAKTPITGITIQVDDRVRYQTIDGFGYALTGGSAMHMIRMSAPARAALIKELFTTSGKGIGISYLRISVGASDLNERVFSYDDVPAGETDVDLKRFDLGPDKADVIPVLKEILAVSPQIKILASPWSPPAWMKTNQDTRGGRLKPEYYNTYARYLVKYIQGMAAEGILIDALTVQNEPLHPGNNPSVLMPAPDQADFIKKHLGPAFAAAHIKTKIIIYDHNADRPDYPIEILNDPQARKYINGSGFHLYGGKIEALSEVHNAHPDKQLYFTEQMVVQRPADSLLNITNPVRRIIIGALRNWCRNVLLWNLAADPENKPFTDRGGCSMCQGAVTIDGDQVTRNLAYYALAHVSKFVPQGSVCIASTTSDSLSNVAFQTPSGNKVLLVANSGTSPQEFSIVYKGAAFSTHLEKGAVATYIWH
ncbi:MAG TPA: glycoside hydrolase family 30 beta sandwich domain-containing protein [Flavisolibacter sp.]|jgi:glucosylceramidase|nr:glycoside hydrolase family 30 beta sandwich domain-containing protein [Flavisolibacter sp.]